MRVLMTADTVGGVWTYALELARALAPHDVQFDLATMGAALSPAQWEEVSSHPNVTVHESLYKLEWMDYPWADLIRAGDWLVDLERRTVPDIVHLNGYAHGTLPWTAPTLMVAHSCVLSWWRAVKGEAAPDSWARYRDVVQTGLCAADAVAAPSGAMRDALYAEYDNLPPICVVPNCRDASLYHPCAKEPIILSAGRLWDEAKNVAALARVAPLLPWPIFVAGDDVAPKGAAADACSAPLQRLGRLSQPALAQWLAQASIYALPARYEPFGLSVLEAALSDCALVLGDIPSLREVWGDAALFVPPDDPVALELSLRRLIDDADERMRLVKASRERAALYSPEAAAKAYLSLYDGLLHTRPMKPIDYIPNQERALLYAA